MQGLGSSYIHAFVTGFGVYQLLADNFAEK